MADKVVRTEEERPRDTVVVEREGKNSAGLIILAIIGFLLLLFFVFGNPFAGNDNDLTPDVNVDVPAAPTESVPTTPAE